MQYADGMQKLSATFLSHKIANVPDIQTAESEQVGIPKTTMEGYYWMVFFAVPKMIMYVTENVIVTLHRTPR